MIVRNEKIFQKHNAQNRVTRLVIERSKKKIVNLFFLILKKNILFKKKNSRFSSSFEKLKVVGNEKEGGLGKRQMIDNSLELW
jgi:hypothetical protein